MNLCFYLHKKLRISPSYSHGRLARILTFEAVCAVAMLFSGIRLLAADSQFPDFPPVAPAKTGAPYGAKLPTYSMDSSVAPAKVEVDAAKLPAYSTTPSPVAASPAVITAVTNISAEAMDTSAVANISTNPMDLLDNQYRLKPGDTVNFQVLEDKADPDDSGEAQQIVVTDSGDAQIPYIGPYPAVGKTCLELARQLKGELERKYYYQATVIISVKSMTSKGVIYVMGGVRTPGPLEMPRDDVLTVSKAVLRAGGFDDFADQKHVQVTRRENGTNTVFTVNVSAVLDRSKIDQDRDTQPGDFIYVPEKTFRY